MSTCASLYFALLPDTATRVRGIAAVRGRGGRCGSARTALLGVQVSCLRSAVALESSGRERRAPDERPIGRRRHRDALDFTRLGVRQSGVHAAAREPTGYSGRHRLRLWRVVGLHERERRVRTGFWLWCGQWGAPPGGPPEAARRGSTCAWTRPRGCLWLWLCWCAISTSLILRFPSTSLVLVVVV